jgi:hypothetical protein
VANLLGIEFMSNADDHRWNFHDLDWRADATGNRVDFTFDGFDGGDEVSGRGWARVDGGELKGWFAFHQGDESEFTARKGGQAQR